MSKRQTYLPPEKTLRSTWDEYALTLALVALAAAFALAVFVTVTKGWGQ